MTFRPTCPLELARLELSRIRALSNAEAQRKTMRAVYSRSVLVSASIMRTPVTRCFAAS
jgi:hypothetical protein